MQKKKKILISGSGGFIFGNFIRQVFYEKKPYQISSLDRVRESHIIHSIYKNADHDFYIADIRDSHTLRVIFEKLRPDVVVHGAAESNVDKSIGSAQPFTTSNVVGTQNVIDECIRTDCRMVYMSCYDEETRAVTRDGLKSFDELKVGDFVLSINPNTGKSEEKEIEKVIIQDYEGDMLEFKSSRVDLLTTPNHRFVLTNKNDIYWKTAEELEINCNDAFFPTGKIENKESLEVNVPGIGMVDSEALFYMSGAFIGDGFLGYQEKIVKNKSGYNREELIKRSKDSKTGKFTKVSGGPNKTSTCHSYRIFFDIPENDKARKPLEDALNSLGIKFYSQKNKSGEHIYFSSKEWSAFFKQFGKHSGNKNIPSWMLSHGYNDLFSLWSGIHDSDGHGFCKAGRNVNITTISKKLKNDLLYLGQMLGFNTRFKKRYSESYLEGRKISGHAYVVAFSGKRNIKIPKPIRKQYSGKIWCLKVKDNKNFLVERNGKTFFCGNTDEVYGALGPDDEAWSEDSPLNPRNTYSATKAAGELLVKAAAATHGLRFNIVRASNNYGPWQSTDKFIPRIIDRVLKGNPVPIYGKGEQIRDWIHVYDTCAGIFKVIDSGVNEEVYNITAKQEFSNIEIFQIVCNALGKGHDLQEFVPDRLGHDFRYAITNDKIKSLGWEPKYKFRDGVLQTCQWYVDNQYVLEL